MQKKIIYLISGLLLFFLSGDAMALTLTSTAFNNNDLIPIKYTCDAENISPPLNWQDAPANTQSFVLIMDDPDAPMGTWDHWILFNIPATVNQLPENIKNLPTGTQTGKNSWGNNNYGGPCPPDKIHRYFFKLYALDSDLKLSVGVNKATIETAMQNHILAKTELIGRYDRKK